MSRQHCNIAAALAVLSLISCRESLCYNHFGSADVEISWDTPPDSPSAPGSGGITVITFNEDGQPTESFISPGGGTVNFGQGGASSILIYNNDTYSVGVYGQADGPEAVWATSTEGSRPAPDEINKKHPGEICLNPPDILYAAYIPYIADVGNHEAADVQADLHPLVFTYEIRYEFEHGFDNITDARGAISGMAEKVYLYNGYTPYDAATLVFDCRLGQNAVTASVTSFGTPGYLPGGETATRATQSHTLNLEVMLANGKSKQFNIDISEQMHPQPRGGNITVAKLRIEDSDAGNDAGFDTDVDDWGNNEEIEFPL